MLSILFSSFVFLIIMVFALGTTVFWVWMLIECLTKEPSDGNDKLIWAIVILFTHFIGALIYYLARRPERIERYGV